MREITNEADAIETLRRALEATGFDPEKREPPTVEEFATKLRAGLPAFLETMLPVVESPVVMGKELSGADLQAVAELCYVLCIEVNREAIKRGAPATVPHVFGEHCFFMPPQETAET